MRVKQTISSLVDKKKKKKKKTKKNQNNMIKMSQTIISITLCNKKIVKLKDKTKEKAQIKCIYNDNYNDKYINNNKGQFDLSLLSNVKSDD